MNELLQATLDWKKANPDPEDDFFFEKEALTLGQWNTGSTTDEARTMTWGYQSPHYEDITRSTNPFWRNTQVEPPGPIVHLDWSGWRERDNLPGFRGNWQAVLPDGDLVNSPVNISASDYNNVPFRERAYMNAFEIATNLVREAYPNARIG